MTTYVDKDTLLHKMQERHEDLARDYGDYDNYVMGVGDAIELLENASAADVREVKHAKWIYRGEDAICSNCGQLTEDRCIEGDNESGYYTVLPHYCSACGALMNLEDD